MGIRGKIVEEPFKNFSHNRNVALQSCIGMSDYVLFLDHLSDPPVSHIIYPNFVFKYDIVRINNNEEIDKTNDQNNAGIIKKITCKINLSEPAIYWQ